MRISEYLKDKIISIIIYILLFILTTSLLIVFKSHIVLLIYIPSILVVLGLTMINHDYYKRKGFYDNFSRILDELDKKYLIAEIVKEPNFLEGKIIYDYLYDINKSMIEEINEYKYITEDFKEYIELWCHEIKTPLATSEMIVENNRNDITNSIEEELNKIDNYIEQILYYARSENVEKDYIIKETNIKNIIDKVIMRNKKDLISKKIKLELTEIDVNIFSDSKWLEFILNQIVINSIKYSKDLPIIKISTKQNKDSVELYIEDNGIGIIDSEIAKVFSKGFTGINGRNKYKSTGIGLYLCNKLCNKLDHKILIESIVNQSTIVKIIFPLSSLTKITK